MARVLVIDDDRVFTTLVAEALAAAGHRVDVAADGRQGIVAVRTTRFDAVVTDIIMPDQEGIETIRLIRRSDPELPILAMSGGGLRLSIDLLQMARAIGADDTISKPFLPSELVRRVEALLSRRAEPPAAAAGTRH
jgi:DNA-binding response OmpR family regulator